MWNQLASLPPSNALASYAPGQMQTMTAPTPMPGMMPPMMPSTQGMGLHPMYGQHHGGQMMPGGGMTGAPMQPITDGGFPVPPGMPGGTVGMVPGVPGSMGLNPAGDQNDPGKQMNPWRQAIHDWRDLRPQHPQGPLDATGQADWRTQIMDWRNTRPDRSTFF